MLILVKNRGRRIEKLPKKQVRIRWALENPCILKLDKYCTGTQALAPGFVAWSHPSVIYWQLLFDHALGTVCSSFIFDLIEEHRD